MNRVIREIVSLLGAIVIAASCVSCHTKPVENAVPDNEPGDVTDPQGPPDAPVEDDQGDIEDDEDTPPSEEPTDPPTSEPTDPPEGDVPEEQPPEPVTAEECAAALAELGIIRDGAVSEDGTVELRLDEPLTRQEAVTYIARALGYESEGADIDYPHPFTDVEERVSGAVGLAYLTGIFGGTSENTFGSDSSVTWAELDGFLLRALGLDAEREEQFKLSLSIGIIDSPPTDPEAAVTRGDAARMLIGLLKARPQDDGKTLLGMLVESGLVTAASAGKAGLSEYISDVDEDAVTAREAMELLGPAVVLVNTKDIMLNSLGSCHGSIVAEGIVAVPLEAIKGAMYISVIDSADVTFQCTGVFGYDIEAGVAYLKCGATAVDIAELISPPTAFSKTSGASDASDPTETTDAADTTGPEAGGAGSATVYTVSDEVLPSSVGLLRTVPALPVIDDTGKYRGITTLMGLEMPSLDADRGMGVYDLCMELWPEICPPVRPRGVDPTKPMTAVTYDDGPSRKITPQLLDLLEEHGAVATFFEVGQMLKNTTRFLQRMEDMGCEVANHTYDHKYFNKLSAAAIHDEIEKTNDIIKSVLGHGASLVRCPGGITTDVVRETVEYPLIYWTIDTRDWESRDAQKVIDHVVKDKNLDGDIILMHSLYESTLEASRTIIPYILENGYQMVTVSELAFFRGVELQNGVTYYRFAP